MMILISRLCLVNNTIVSLLLYHTERGQNPDSLLAPEISPGFGGRVYASAGIEPTLPSLGGEGGRNPGARAGSSERSSPLLVVVLPRSCVVPSASRS